MQIVPINKLKDTAQISEMCHTSKEPIFITKNGYGDMVIMNLKTYEKEQEEKMLLQRVVNVISGKEQDGDIALAELREKYAL